MGFLSEATERLFVAMWLLGWALVVWAVILGAVGAAQLIRQVFARQRPAWPAAVLVTASVALTVVVIGAHPLWGTGSGVG